MSKLFASLVLVSTILLACGGGKQFWSAQPVQGAVSISPEQIWIAHNKLWVRVVVTNGTQMPIMINRDQIVARLPNGMVLQRAQGTYTQHFPYTVLPGGVQPVYVEFFSQGFDWHTVPNAQVDFTPGTTANGQPVQVPPLVVTNGG